MAPLVGRLVPAAQLLLREQGPGPAAALGAGSALAAPGVVLLNHFFELWEVGGGGGSAGGPEAARCWRLQGKRVKRIWACGTARIAADSIWPQAARAERIPVFAGVAVPVSPVLTLPIPLTACTCLCVCVCVCVSVYVCVRV